MTASQSRATKIPYGVEHGTSVLTRGGGECSVLGKHLDATPPCPPLLRGERSGAKLLPGHPVFVANPGAFVLEFRLQPGTFGRRGG